MHFTYEKKNLEFPQHKPTGGYREGGEEKRLPDPL